MIQLSATKSFLRTQSKYLRYVLRHKWYVFQEACKLGIPWLGLVHDMSKFLPDEWLPYAEHFYGEGAVNQRDSTGYYKPTDTGDAAFDYAWFLHQKRNKHHWSYWIIPQHDGKFKVLEMPVKYENEMIADWRGAGRAQGNPNTWEWYAANKDKMMLAPWTRFGVDTAIAVQEKEARNRGR